jgi:hypothetical protein
MAIEDRVREWDTQYMDLATIGRFMILGGLVLAAAGVLLVLGSRIPGLGQLPGDIIIQRDGFTLYFPLATMIVVSVVLTVILNIAARLFR